jgi:uncharacterized Zn-finger protein
MALFVEETSEAECPFCGKNFETLGRHTWRCKSSAGERNANFAETSSLDASRITDKPGNSIVANNQPRASNRLLKKERAIEAEGPKSREVTCYCGRKFRSHRGWRLHRRSCSIGKDPDLKGLLDPNNLDEDGANESREEGGDRGDEGLCVRPRSDPLPGVKLPRSKRGWELANEFFKSQLDFTSKITDVNGSIRRFQAVIYNYFKENHGACDKSSCGKFEKYNTQSKSQLKKTLKKLKQQSGPLSEVKYVARLLRSKLSGKNGKAFRDHQYEIESNFWKYCKSMFNTEENVLPAFNKETCFDFFRQVLSEKRKRKTFSLPSWLKPLPKPVTEFDLSPPTYKEVTAVIRKTKSSGSPCPLDHISILPMKHCPALRTYLWQILTVCWEQKIFPEAWKNGITILAHKSGPADQPSNFRPITLEPILAKIFTSILRNRIYRFVKSNDFIEDTFQKGFWSDISGTIEHTETMTFMINNARVRQRNLVITLLDLRNAFGEVHHNILDTVLEYHHVPPEIGRLVRSLYQGFQVSIATRLFLTDPICVQRGVLQGDSLSPLLFNLLVNTLISSIKAEKVRCLGYTSACSTITRHWFQFADDTAITTANEEDNQLLCNFFTKWASWADLHIRAEKCHTFGVKKSGSRSMQYKPNIKIANQQVPPVDLGESFQYLGKEFSFSMSCDSVKTKLLADVSQYLAKIDLIPIKPLHKIKIVNQFVYSKLRWRFSIYDLTSTWVRRNVENVISNSVRKWLEIPISGNISHLSFPIKDLGLNFKGATDIYEECQLSVRRLLRTSSSEEVRQIANLTTNKHFEHDKIVSLATSRNAEKSAIKAETIKAVHTEKLNGKNASFCLLKEQSKIIAHLKDECTTRSLQKWHQIVARLPSNITKFCRKALIFSLANGSNLKRWTKIDDGKCKLCGEIQTQLHVFSWCKSALDRYLWRHNSILQTIVHYLMQARDAGTKIYADLPGSNLPHPSQLFASQIPDIVIVKQGKISVIELTVPFETNSSKARTFKANKYKDLRSQLLNPCEDFRLIPVEVTTLGFFTKNDYEFKETMRDVGICVERLTYKMSEVAIRSTFYIYCRRNKTWNCPELLAYI